MLRHASLLEATEGKRPMTHTLYVAAASAGGIAPSAQSVSPRLALAHGAWAGDW
jgi:hypothetical protein